MVDKPVLHLEELNLTYEGGKSAKYAYRARVAGGWLIFIWTPERNGLGGATFYPDPDHLWDGGTQEGCKGRSIAGRGDCLRARPSA